LLAQIGGFHVSLLDEPDQPFIEVLRRFKPLLAEEGHYRNFQSIADVECARGRLDELVRMVKVFVAEFPGIRESLRKTFKTATVQFGIRAKYKDTPVTVSALERLMA